MALKGRAYRTALRYASASLFSSNSRSSSEICPLPSSSRPGKAALCPYVGSGLPSDCFDLVFCCSRRRLFGGHEDPGSPVEALWFRFEPIVCDHLSERRVHEARGCILNAPPWINRSEVWTWKRKWVPSCETLEAYLGLASHPDNCLSMSSLPFTRGTISHRLLSSLYLLR